MKLPFEAIAIKLMINVIIVMNWFVLLLILEKQELCYHLGLLQDINTALLSRLTRTVK